MQEYNAPIEDILFVINNLTSTIENNNEEYGNKQEKKAQVNLWAPKGKKYGTVSAIQIDKSGGYIRGNQQTQPIWFEIKKILGKP